jgi:hypothetical protein
VFDLNILRPNRISEQDRFQISANGRRVRSVSDLAQSSSLEEVKGSKSKTIL